MFDAWEDVFGNQEQEVDQEKQFEKELDRQVKYIEDLEKIEKNKRILTIPSEQLSDLEKFQQAKLAFIYLFLASRNKGTFKRDINIVLPKPVINLIASIMFDALNLSTLLLEEFGDLDKLFTKFTINSAYLNKSEQHLNFWKVPFASTPRDIEKQIFQDDLTTLYEYETNRSKEYLMLLQSTMILIEKKQKSIREIRSTIEFFRTVITLHRENQVEKAKENIRKRKAETNQERTRD